LYSFSAKLCGSCKRCKAGKFGRFFGPRSFAKRTFTPKWMNPELVRLAKYLSSLLLGAFHLIIHWFCLLFYSLLMSQATHIRCLQFLLLFLLGLFASQKEMNSCILHLECGMKTSKCHDWDSLCIIPARWWVKRYCLGRDIIPDILLPKLLAKHDSPHRFIAGDPVSMIHPYSSWLPLVT
jgi:hypothetical protein